jgi:hypothetical protein
LRNGAFQRRRDVGRIFDRSFRIPAHGFRECRENPAPGP